MKLTSTYVVGELELIKQAKGQIAVRMKNCGPKIKVYGDKQMENSFAKKIYGEFSKDNLTLSHSLISFAEGDKVKLIRHYDDEGDDKFTLKNLSLLSSKLGRLDELIPKSGENYFSIDVKGTLEHLGWNKTKVFIRIKCVERKYVSFDANRKMSEKIESFEKEIFVEIPREALRLDVCIKTLAVYKKGDNVCLSRMVDDDASFDFDNLTLSVCHAEPNYHSPFSL